MSTTNFQRLMGLLLLGAGIVLFALAARNASAATLTVDDDGNAEYTKIQEAINAAGNGDTIRVWEGTYEENVVVDKSVSLVGNGSKETAIDAGGKGTVVKIEADWVNMSGFRVKGSGLGYKDTGIEIVSNHNHVFDNNCSNNDYGIYLSSSNNCTLENNTCSSNNDYGIWLEASINCTLENNICLSNNRFGILLIFSSECTIKNNTCSSNFDSGIWLTSPNNCTLVNNTCSSNNGNGLFLIGSSDCIITSNIFDNNWIGISLSTDSRNNTITNNIMNMNGISISGSLENWNSHSIETTNTVNGKPIYYYKNVANFTVPSGAGQIILANCTWIKVENQNCSNAWVGILIYSSNNIIIENNTCSSNNKYGICLYLSRNCTITNNTCSSNNGNGIYLWDSRDCTLENNTCSLNIWNGIYLSSSRDCIITSNTCSNNGESGILGGSFNAYSNNTCENNGEWGILGGSSSTFNNNTCSNNGWVGIYLGGSSDCIINNNTCSNNDRGIYLSSSRDCTITNNTCYSNNGYGIRLKDSSDCTINNNTCSNNNHGIDLYSSRDCTLENNTISENRVGIYLKSSSLNNKAHYNKICDNFEYGINATDNDGYTINATYNWWGDNSGPYHSSENIEGKGNNVTDDVLFDPWLQKEEPQNKKPTLTITSPTNKSDVSHTVTITGTAADEDGTIEKVEVSINSGGWETAAGTTSWTFEWNTTAEENDEYSLKFRAFDGEDFSEIIEITLNVQKPAPENQPPTVTISSPTNGSKVSGTITINGTATDPEGNVQKVEVSINGENWTSITGITSWSFEWDSKEMDNGEYTIKVRSYDGTNYSEEVTITVTVDNKDDGGGGGGFIPGFGAAVVVSTIGVTIVLYRRRGKKAMVRFQRQSHLSICFSLFQESSY